MSSISSFHIISIVVPEPNIFLCIPASSADAAPYNPNGIKKLLANGLIIFFINVLFLIMDQEVYRDILLTASSKIIDLLIA